MASSGPTNTFGLVRHSEFEWDPDAKKLNLFFVPLPDVDSRINQMVAIDFKKESFFKRGRFPPVVANGTEQISLVNPWLKSYNNSAPFDRCRSLLLQFVASDAQG